MKIPHLVALKKEEIASKETASRVKTVIFSPPKIYMPFDIYLSADNVIYSRL